MAPCHASNHNATFIVAHLRRGSRFPDNRTATPAMARALPRSRSLPPPATHPPHEPGFEAHKSEAEGAHMGQNAAPLSAADTPAPLPGPPAETETPAARTVRKANRRVQPIDTWPTQHLRDAVSNSPQARRPSTQPPARLREAQARQRRRPARAAGG